jgi:hypothetical protein
LRVRDLTRFRRLRVVPQHVSICTFVPLKQVLLYLRVVPQHVSICTFVPLKQVLLYLRVNFSGVRVDLCERLAQESVVPTPPFSA